MWCIVKVLDAQSGSLAYFQASQVAGIPTWDTIRTDVMSFAGTGLYIMRNICELPNDMTDDSATFRMRMDNFRGAIIVQDCGLYNYEELSDDEKDMFINDYTKGENQFCVDFPWNTTYSGITVENFYSETLPNGTGVGFHVHNTKNGYGIWTNGNQFAFTQGNNEKLFLTAYMRAKKQGHIVDITIENRAGLRCVLSTEWQRFQIETTTDGQGHALTFYGDEGDFDICCLQFGMGTANPTWQPAFLDKRKGTQTGSYVGIASWDKPYAPIIPIAYQWNKVKGENGEKGKDGKDADYQEYRFAKNGSTTAAPTLNKSMPEPTGWTLEQPVIGKMEYLWATIAKKKADGTLLTSWSEPVRMTPYDGKNGKDGKDGVSPALVFCGVYDPSKTYYGNQYRIDACKYGNAYYVCRVDAGEFKGVVPTNTAKWNSFGASFESIATNLLLAEGANIAGWIFRNNRLESQDGTFWLDGIEGKMMAKGGFSGALRAESLFVPFVSIYETRNLKKTDPTNIILSSRFSALTLPHNDFSFNGMFLNIYIPPRISRDSGGIVNGRILCPNKGTIINSTRIEEYYAKNISSIYGGVLQIVNVVGVWVLLNGTDYLTYEKA